MTLYLNKIFFGHRSYGIQAAARNYYGVSVDKLTISQIATLAGLPKAPSRDNPISNPLRSEERRLYVLNRMLEHGYISSKEFSIAKNAKVKTYFHGPKLEVFAPEATEMVRKAMYEAYGDKAYELGLSITTTIDSHIQKQANGALDKGIEAYDKRHGYRKPTTVLPDEMSNGPSYLSLTTP